MMTSTGQRRRIIVLLLLAMVASILVLPQQARALRQASAEDTVTTLTKRLDAFMRSLVTHHQFSGSVLVVRRGVVLLNKGYGWADAAHHIANTAATEYRIGSVTKQFTALALLLLQAQGKVHVQDHLCRYISDCPLAWRPITLRQLLTHTSGIHNYTDLPIFDVVINQPTTPTELISRFKDLPLDFKPGSTFSYSNSNYLLLGYIISKVSGLSYGAFLQQHILTPLHLLHTGYAPYHPWSAGHAIGYLRWEEPAPPYDMTEAYAAGGLYSTVGDLYRWDQALLRGPFPSQQIAAQMIAPAVMLCAHSCGGPFSQVGYGYGLYVGRLFNQALIYHPGSTNGYMARNLLNPQAQITVIVLSNLDAPSESAFPLDAMALGQKLPPGFSI